MYEYSASVEAVVAPVTSINDQLVAAGHAFVWNGTGARPVSVAT